MSFAVFETLPNGMTRQIAAEQTLLQAIARALDDEQLDTVDLAELHRRYLPEARIKAVNTESRTRPVRLPEPTAIVPAAAIRRQLRGAAAAEGELE